MTPTASPDPSAPAPGSLPTQSRLPRPPADDGDWLDPSASAAASPSRRRFLRGAAVASGGLLAVGVAACANTVASPTFTFAPPVGGASGDAGASAGAGGSAGAGAGASTSPGHGTMAGASGSPGASGAPIDHDALAAAVVKRFVGGEAATLPEPNPRLQPTIEGNAKVFRLTVDAIQHRIDAQKPPVAALGFNGVWTGPRLEVVEGDLVRAIFTNNLDESTGIHFHGQAVPNRMDGVPHLTQEPIQPGGRFTYEFRAGPSGSHMYHSHHNATDQVGRGLLGAFIVQPRDPAQRYDRLYGATQDIVWISNDTLGGFTINGRGFPATYPIAAKLGETIVIRFMNEGIMTHPWHLHGLSMHVVARDGYPLGSAAFRCDTLGVNPGERWDVVIHCDNPGAWAFHCHVLPHAEGRDGMYGMVTALIVA